MRKILTLLLPLHASKIIEIMGGLDPAHLYKMCGFYGNVLRHLSLTLLEEFRSN